MIIKRSIQSPYTQEQLFKLVTDISEYPRFLPYCQGAIVLGRQGNRVKGTLHIGYKGLSYPFATQNLETPPSHIRMQLLSGPLQKLEGDWVFDSLPTGGCQVRLQVELLLKPAVLGILFKSKIDEITDLMVDAFVKRAKDLYG